ncbi:MAG TPA: translocation/assembly module TamB domain-containing protein, partial [Chitinophagaceae bacterium]|nr:translocation/assembly module TamB domain-containing protein [Chitinophagaceae bacterium]
LFVPELRSNPALRNPNDVWNINLVGSGTTDHFNFETLQFAGLSSTQVNAHGSLSGLTNPKNAGGNFVIDRFHTNQNDIALFTGSKLSNEQVKLPHDFTIRGTINGNAGTINTKMRILTSDGNISVNGKFSNFTNPAKTRYNGQITTSNLQVGKILRQENTIGPLSATIVANGQGLTPDAINTKFSAAITSASYDQYQYKNINISGSLQKTNFDVHAVIKDPNADADITVKGNYSSHPAFAIHGMIDSVKTLPLHLTTEPLIIRGRIDGTASDLTADNVNADILITQALLVSGRNRLALDTIQLESGKRDTANYIRLNSSIVKANIVGHYRLADLGSIMQNSIQPYFTTGSTKLATVQPYYFTFSLDVIYDPVFAAFVPGLTDMEPLHASGNFSNNGGINIELTTASVVYQGNTISDVKLTANTTSNGLQVDGGIAHLKSSSFDLYNSRVNAVILNNNINFSVGTDDAKGKNKYFIAGLFSQPTTGTYNIQLKPDSLLLNYQRWSVTPDNLITIKPDDIIASNFVLQNGEQRLSINSPDSRGKQLLLVELSNFRLATITEFANVDSLLADGVINGNIRLGNFMQQPNFTGDLTITDLSVQKDTVGNVKIHASSGEANRYNIESTITGHGNDVSLAGWIATEANDTKLNLDLDVKTLQLHSIEPFTAGAIRNTSGTLNGNIAIRGSVNNPALNGDLNFNKSSFALSMLGSQFHVDDQKISLTNDGISFSKFTLKDSSGNAMTLDGNIITNNFINYEYNLKLTARNFQLLNSTKKDNPIYYGRMTINTDLSISGTEVSPAVDGRIIVDNGTSLTFVVPQGDESAESREGIVEFVDMSNPVNDSLFKKYDSLNTSAILGMDISLNIEIKKEAVFNIIVDAANGDFLNAQGEAQLTAGIDPSGKITLTGNYTLEKGSYQLSFNLLQRKFEINKGSSITWTGEPTTAQLDVTAVYIANTAPIDLVQDQIASTTAAIKNTYMQKLPFQVHLKLTGELMKPVVAFDIVLPQDKNYGVSNDVVTTVEYKLAQLRADEGETNKQVFSLLLLNRFVGENPFASEGTGSGFSAETYVRQSASKLLTQQLNQLAAGLINGVDINFDVVSTEDYTTGSMRNKTDLNVNVSKRLLNDRLKISVGSDFGLEGPQTTNQQGNNIAGNLSAEYQLSRDGRYLLRFFEKNDYEGELYGYVIETGLSFVITVDYNRFKEIFRKRKQRVESTDTQKVTTK